MVFVVFVAFVVFVGFVALSVFVVSLHHFAEPGAGGRIIEFPLTNVSKVYRIVKNDDKWCPLWSMGFLGSLACGTMQRP